MKNNDEKSIITESFLQHLKCNSKSLHVILYNIPNGFEYDEDTLMVRPLNTVLWYDTNLCDRGDAFSNFLSSYCKSTLDKLDDNGYARELPVGVFENSCLSIDLDKFENVMITKARRFYLENSYQNFKHFINGIYKINNTILKNAIRYQANMDLL